MLRLLSAAMSPYSAQTMCPTQRQTRPRHTDRMRSRRRGDKTTPSQTRPGAARHCDGSHLLLFVLGDAGRREVCPVKLTIGKTRDLFFLVVAICVVVLILTAVLTWEDVIATAIR